MGPIRQLFSTSPDLKKTESNKKLDRANENNKSDAKSTKASDNSKDQVQISDKGRELLTLKMEAQSYLDEVKDSHVVSQKDIDEIKEKIASKYYFDEEVVNDLVDRLVNLPDYFDLK